MIEYREVESKILHSCEKAAVRGIDIMITDTFIWKDKDAIVAILKTNPLHSPEQYYYSYGIYLPIFDEGVPEGSKAYDGFVRQLPPINQYMRKLAGGTFLEKMELEKQCREYQEAYVNSGRISAEYKQTLRKISQIYDDSTQKIYQFFIDQL